MKTRELLGALIVVAAGLWLVDRCAAERGRAAAALVPRASETREAAPPRELDGEPIPAPAPERVELAPLPTAQSAPTAVAPPAPAAAEAPDLAARDWLEIQVLDPEGRGVFDAELSIDGVRKQGDRGSWYGMRDGPALARSDAQGRARIEYVRWVDIDGRTIEVDLEVTHPEFAPFRDSSFAIGAGQHPVVLQRGATVIVSGWTGSPRQALTELRIQVDSESQLPSSAWVREHDGRLSTTRLLPGRHRVWITHASAEHGALTSAIETFELAEDEWKELEVELWPPVTLRGRLDDAVPRPVLEGHVGINLHEGGTGLDDAEIDRDFEAPVRADGTFELAGLPPASGQIIALCRGWVSRRTRVATLEEAGVHLGLEPGREPTRAEIEDGLQLAGDSAFQTQRITVPAAEPFVVVMEPTGILEVTVRTQEGAPLAGARVGASPNVYWVGVGSTIFPWREWSAVTDAGGRARIEDLPPDDTLWVGARHAAHRMTRAERDDNPSVELVSGRTATLELVLEPGSEDGGD